MTINRNKIDSDLIPYACYVDNNTIITKNGMLLQTVTFDSNIDSQEDFREEIRSFIQSCYNQDLGIYLHTIKISKGDDESEVLSKRIEDDVAKKISEIFNFSSDNEISYNVTFIYRIEQKGSMDVTAMFVPSIFYQKYEAKIQKTIRKLNKITDAMVLELEDYNPRKLGIVKHDKQYEAEYMNFLGKLINFQDDKFELPLGGLCYSTNYSYHKFLKNKFSVKNDDGVKKFAATFSLKEYSEVSCQIVYQMLQSLPNVLVCQVVLPIDNRVLVKEYEKISEIYNASNEPEFKAISTLESVDELMQSRGKKNIYAKCQTTFTVVGNSLEELEKLKKTVSGIFSNVGIVAFVEDVHLQNAFFSIIPGNFRFSARLSNIPIPILAGFAYAEGSESAENTDYMWGKVLMTLQKIDNRRYRLGMPLEQRNLLIVGANGSGRSILGNIIALGCVRNEVGVLYLDTSHKGDASAKLAGMELLNISLNEDIEWCGKINPFAGVKDSELQKSYITTMMKAVAKSNGIPIENVPKFVNLLVSAGESFLECIKTLKLQNEMSDWLPNGKYCKIFNHNIGDDALSIGKDVRLIVEESLLEDEKCRLFTGLVILLKILNIVEDGSRKIIILSDIFKVLKTQTEAKILEQILKSAREKSSISFVFITSSDDKIEFDNPIKEVVLKYTEHRAHFGNDRASIMPEYKELWGLSSKDIDAIATLDKNHGRCFAMFTPYNKSYVKFELANLGDILRILSDASGRIMNIVHQKMTEEGISDRRMAYEFLLNDLENGTISDAGDDEEDEDAEDLLLYNNDSELEEAA